jgi:hypothetical protein
VKRFEELNVLAQEALGGLNAGQDLKLKILKAARAQKKPAARSLLRPMPIMAMAAVLVVLAAAGYLLAPGALTPGTSTNGGNDVFDSLPAGQTTASSLAAGQNTVMPFRARALLDVPPGSISLTSGSNTPEYRSIWEKGGGGNFPLIGVNGKYYRMMRNPSSIPQNLVGGGVGQISEYTDEPALADPNQIISNAVNQGETVYAVDGMGEALVAASVNGEMRVFQRVSFANNAILGMESLGDTLGISGKVIGMELTDVGTVSDESKAAELADILLSNASFVDTAGSQNSNSSLLIQLSNGLFVQMFVKNDTLSACGTWSCPEFFEAFQAAMQ